VSLIARALGGETDLDRVLELIVKRGRALVEARAIVLLLPEGDGLVVRAEAGQIMGTALGHRVKLDRLSGRVLMDNRPLRVHDVANHLQFSVDELGIGGAETALVVPLVYRAEGVGVLAAFDRLVDGPRFHDDDERLVLGFAASAAAALSTAQNVGRDRLRHRIEAAEKERRRWARELHDATLQGLGALKLGLSTARRTNDVDALERAVGDAIEHLGDEIATLRALITELRPAALDDLGVGAAVEALVERARTRHGLEIVSYSNIEFERGEGSRLTTEIETVIYRTVQEALTNASKHAAASTVHIAITEGRDSIRVVIADDGGGFDPASATEGFGLIGMQERAALVDGELDIETGPRGTNVRLVLPARHRGDAPQPSEVVV
jgi:signal transduction histidine kinase